MPLVFLRRSESANSVYDDDINLTIEPDISVYNQSRSGSESSTSSSRSRLRLSISTPSLISSPSSIYSASPPSLSPSLIPSLSPILPSLRSSSPPPPIPRRSSRRPRPLVVPAPSERAELNGQLSPVPSPQYQSKYSQKSPKTVRFADTESVSASDSASKSTTRTQRESIRPMTTYGPFHRVMYRGRSILYHVDAQGEYSF